MPDPEDTIQFTCNLCGNRNQCAIGELKRETRNCTRCGSTMRMRAFVLALSDVLFGQALVLDAFPPSPRLRGIGLSDWNVYANRLAAKFDYLNTRYDREPRLDITDVPASWRGTCDFVTSNDVFEHVAPPVSAAFDGALSLLKPGGVLVLCVPFLADTEHTTEHYPELHDFRIHGKGEDARLHNRTRDGREQVFDGLAFHGGEGSTLEMRVFSKAALVGQLQSAGFIDIALRDQDALDFGVHWPLGKSFPVTARRPPA